MTRRAIRREPGDQHRRPGPPGKIRHRQRLGDPARPLRPGLRRGLRGHDASRAVAGEGERRGRLRAAAGSRQDPQRCHR